VPLRPEQIRDEGNLHDSAVEKNCNGEPPFAPMSTPQLSKFEADHQYLMRLMHEGYFGFVCSLLKVDSVLHILHYHF
jgi:hypothetical protein